MKNATLKPFHKKETTQVLPIKGQNYQKGSQCPKTFSFKIEYINQNIILDLEHNVY